MKKAIVSTITALSVLLAVMMLAGCDLLSPKEDDPPKQTGTEEPETPDTPDTPEGPAVFEKELWGEWLRMDTGEKWYISSSAIKIGGSVSTKTVSLTKQSERTVEVSDGGRKYYLYASRIANTSFTGKIASFDAPSGRALGGIGGIGVSIANLKDKANEVSATTDADGNFTARSIIPGDEYEVTPEGGTPTTITPQGVGDDVGTITITDGVNFKTSIKSSSTDMTRLYANMNSYTFDLVIENTGTEDCTAATYSLDFTPDLIAESIPDSGVLGTIEPGKTKTIEIKVRCRQIQNEYEYKKIGITINDPISDKQWQDSVSLKFNKAPVNFNIKSNSAVSGVIIAPTAQAYSSST